MSPRSQLAAVALLAVAVGLFFLQAPGFGDDLTYWSFAFDLHERGRAAWSAYSFHQLRWPVWGWCWLWQAIAGPGLSSYYAVPLLYLAAGAMLAFSLGQRLGGSSKLNWACAVAFLLHPLIDTVCYRPMPDLSEGVWGAAAVLSWWNLMHAGARGSRWIYAATTGACVFILEANRVTGVFIVPVLVLCTALFFPRRFGWLLIAGAGAMLLYFAQCLIYHQLFGDWLHDLSANSRNTGRKGTELINAWSLPFRFLDTFWSDPRALLYCVLSLLGMFALWRRGHVLGRVAVLWFALLYFEYACAPQSLSPFRPLLRDAERFLASLAIPGAVLAVFGLQGSMPLLTRLWPFKFYRRLAAQAAVVFFAFALIDRPILDFGFVPAVRAYLASVPSGAHIFTHKTMRDLAFLIDARAASRLRFTAPERILERDPKLEGAAGEAQEFWYVHKLVWLTARKQLEHGGPPPELASYFAAPEHDWTLSAAMQNDENPEFAFYRRRAANAPPAEVLEWPALTHYEKGTTPLRTEEAWNIPQELRGRRLRVDIEAASDEVEGATARLTWRRRDGTGAGAITLKPYLAKSGSRDFFAGEIPADAVRCEMLLKFSRRTERFMLTRVRAVIEPR